jgi:hypothetical protein
LNGWIVVNPWPSTSTIPAMSRRSTSPLTETQVRQVLQRLARDLEDLAAGGETLNTRPTISRQERLADLVPAPPRLSPHEERVQLRRQLGLDLEAV